MLTINFYPESNKKEYIKAAKAYQNIWDKDGQQISSALEKHLSFTFGNTKINALIFESASYFYPLCLRASYTQDIKKGTLIHELGHRLLQNNGINQRGKTPQSFEVHKALFLRLYDIWNFLYGKGFADNNVEIEKQRHEEYKKAWEWILSLSEEARFKKYTQLISQSTK